MIRTQVQLEEEQYRRLREIGAREDKGLAEQVREAVALYLRNCGEPLPPPETLAGRFHRLPAEHLDELKPHDRRLAEAIFASKRR